MSQVWTKYVKRLKRRHQGFGDTFFIDEMFVKIQGRQQHLWLAVDQDGEVIDVFLQARRGCAIAGEGYPESVPRVRVRATDSSSMPFPDQGCRRISPGAEPARRRVADVELFVRVPSFPTKPDRHPVTGRLL